MVAERVQRQEYVSFAREFWLIVLALVFPFITVWIECGFFSMDLLLNLVLGFITFGIGGTLHAIYIVLKKRYETRGYVPIDEEFSTGQEHVPPTVPGNPSSGANQSPVTAKDPVPEFSGSAGPGTSGSVEANSGNVGTPPPYAEVASSRGNLIQCDNKVQHG